MKTCCIIKKSHDIRQKSKAIWIDSTENRDKLCVLDILNKNYPNTSTKSQEFTKTISFKQRDKFFYKFDRIYSTFEKSFKKKSSILLRICQTQLKKYTKWQKLSFICFEFTRQK